MVETHSEGFQAAYSINRHTQQKRGNDHRYYGRSLELLYWREMVASDDIDRVCLPSIAKSSTLIVERQATALKFHGFNPAIAYSSKVILLEADFNVSNLGLSPDIFESVSRENFCFWLILTVLWFRYVYL